MTPEIPYWINLTPTVRQQMRAAYELKEFRACVRELTAVPLEEQVMAENEYLFAENRLFYKNVEALSQYEYVKIPCAEARNLNCSFTARFADGTFHSVTVPDHIFAGYF